MRSDAKSPNISISVGNGGAGAQLDPTMPTGEVHCKVRDLAAEQEELIAAICELNSRLEPALAIGTPVGDEPNPAPCHTSLGAALEEAVIRTALMRRHVQMIISRLEL